MNKQFYFKQLVKVIKHQTYFWPIDNKTLSGDKNHSLSGTGSDGNEGVLRILQNYGITGASPTDWLISWPWHSLRESYPSVVPDIGMMVRVFARETWVQTQIESYQRLKKWYLMPPYLTLSIKRYGSRVKWSNPGKGVVPSPTRWCSKYRKGSLRVTFDYGRQPTPLQRGCRCILQPQMTGRSIR